MLLSNFSRKSSSTSHFRHWSELRLPGNGRVEMVTLGKVLSLTTPRGAIMGKIWLLLVSRSLENEIATIMDLKMLSDIDVRTKPQPQSPCSFMQISLCIILLTHNSIPSKIAFPWSHLHLELSQNFLLWAYKKTLLDLWNQC